MLALPPPFARGIFDALACPQVVAALLDPGSKCSPGSQQRLVGKLHTLIVDGEQPAVGKPRQYETGRGIVAELRPRQKSLGVRCPLARVDQARQESSGQTLLFGVETLPYVVGRAADGTGHPACCLVAGDRELIAHTT